MDQEYKEEKYGEGYFLCYGKDKKVYGWNSGYIINASILKDFLKPKKVLMVGCAKGYYVQAFRDLKVEAYGCDISEWAIENCAADVKDYLQVADILNMPCKDNEFDMVCAFDVLEHLSEDDITTAIKELKRVCSKYLCVSTLFKGNTHHEHLYKLDDTHKTLKPKDWWMIKLGAEEGYVLKPYDWPMKDCITAFPLVDQLIIINVGGKK